MENKKKVKEIIDLWAVDKKQYVKKSTYSAYMLLIENHILSAFGDMDKIQEAEVQSFVFEKLEVGLSQKSIKDILIVLKMVLKFGAKGDLFDYKPFDIKFPTQREKQNIEVLSRSDQKKIMNYVQTHFTFRNLGIYVCLAAGMRIGEVCALTWDDMNTDTGIISIRRTIQRIYVVEAGNRHTEVILDTPKTRNSIRDIPMTRELSRILKPIKKVVNKDFFVLTNEAKPTEPRTYRSYFKQFIKALGIPELKFHGLRHSFATRCIESECDYKTVSVLLGHSNITTTLNLYVHPNLEQKKKCIDKMFKTLK